MTISAPAPTHPVARQTQGHKRSKLCKSRPKPIASSTPPAPPPTSPLRHTFPRRRHRPTRSVTPLETIILGAESDSLRVHYSVHVNLQKLQRGVKDVGGASPEGEWPPSGSHAHKALRATRRKRSSPGTRHEAGGELCSEQHSVCAASLEKPLMKAGGGGGGGGRGGGVEENDRAEAGKIEVEGHTVVPTEHDFARGLAALKKEEGEKIRDAEKTIKQLVSKGRQSFSRIPEGPSTESKGQTAREKLAFDRAYMTMKLSTLKQFERSQEVRRKANARVEQAQTVSRMKQERLERRRHRMELFHRALQDRVTSWRAAEEDRLERLVEMRQAEREDEEERRADVQDWSAMAAQARQEDRQLACEFNQQVSLVGSTLSQEDRKLALERKQQVSHT